MLIIFIVAAVITPTGDPMTQIIFAAPMLVLVRAEHRHRLDRRSRTTHWTHETDAELHELLNDSDVLR